MLKLLWVQEDKKIGINTLNVDLPRLWILAATTNQPVIDDFGGEIGGVSFPGDQQGIYFLPPGFHTAIVSINQLPETSDFLFADFYSPRILRSISLTIEHWRVLSVSF